jgi:transposase
MTGHNPTDRSKIGTKRHILTDKKGIPLSAVISSASTHDIKLVTDVVDNAVIKRPPPSYKTKTTGRGRKLQHLCLDKAYNSQPQEQELIKRGYVLHIPPKRKGGVKEEQEAKITVQHCSNRKNHSAKRWVVERTNSWHNRFRKLLTRYEKKVENYLGLVQLSCCMIIYRKIILG